MAALVERTLTDNVAFSNRLIRRDPEHLLDAQLVDCHVVDQMDDLDWNLCLAQLLGDLRPHAPNIVNLVLSERLIPLGKIQCPVQFIEGNHAELLEHEIVHHDAELLVCELGLKIWYFLAQGASEVFWQHTRIISIPAIAFNDLFGALLIVVKLAANHVDH